MRTLNNETKGSALSNQKKIEDMEKSLKTLSDIVVKLNEELEQIKTEREAEKNRINTESINADVGSFEDARIDTAHIDDGFFNDVSITNKVAANKIEAQNAEIEYSLKANTLDTEFADIEAADINNALINTLKATSAEIDNLSFDNLETNKLESNDIEAKNVVSDSAKFDEVESLNAALKSVISDDIQSTTMSATDLGATNILVEHLKSRDSSIESISYKECSIPVEDPTSDTNFNIIELPRIDSGSYRATYKNVSGETLFSIIVNATFEDISFTYARTDDSRVLDKIAIYGNQLYLQTWYGGQLFYHNDSIEDETSPVIYSDWPIPLDALDYPIYTASRMNATIYTKYFAGKIDDSDLGNALLDMEKTNDLSLVEAEENEIQYDPNNEAHIYIYTPNQSLNTWDEVEFDKVKSNTTETDNLIVNGGMKGQILREKEDGSALQWETTLSKSVDGEVDNKSDKIVEENVLGHWDGGNYSINTEGEVVEGTPSITKLGNVTEGTWNAGDITANTGSFSELYTETLDTTGNVHIAGDLTVDGKTTTVHTEEVTTESNTITLRDGATTAIQPGEVSGIEIENYDGNGTTLQVAVDNEGTLRIGTDIGSSEGDNEPILTRSESEDLANNHLLKWDAANKKAIDSGETIESLKNTVLISKPSDIGLDDSQTYTTKAFFDNMPLQSIAMVPDTYISDDKGSGTYVIYKPITGGKAEFLPLQTTTAAAVDKTKVPTQNIEFYMNYADGSLSGTWMGNPGLYTSAGLILFGSGDIAQGTTYAGNAGTMCIGSPFGVHTEFDGNEIIAKSDATTLGTTYFHGTLNVSQADANLMIPLAAPSSPLNGMIWIA